MSVLVEAISNPRLLNKSTRLSLIPGSPKSLTPLPLTSLKTQLPITPLGAKGVRSTLSWLLPNPEKSENSVIRVPTGVVADTISASFSHGPPLSKILQRIVTVTHEFIGIVAILYS